MSDERHGDGSAADRGTVSLIILERLAGALPVEAYEQSYLRGVAVEV